MDENNNRETREAPIEEKTRATPKPNESAAARDRTGELPADNTRENEKRLEAANSTANQTIDEGNENEVQGKLAVPTVKVMKRGYTKYTDEDGNLVKELNDAEPNVILAEEERPQYLELHQAVLDGGDPIEETLRFQEMDPDEAFAEGKLENAEKHPRTTVGTLRAERPAGERPAEKREVRK